MDYTELCHTVPLKVYEHCCVWLLIKLEHLFKLQKIITTSG